MRILCLPDLHFCKPYTMLPQPNAIDQWLSRNNINSYGSMGDIWSDHVSCMVQLVITPVRSLPSLHTNHYNYLFQKYQEHFYRYNPSLYNEVLELASIDIAHLSNPIVTLGHYEGHHLDAGAPEWTHITSHLVLRCRSDSLAVLWLMFLLKLCSGPRMLILYDIYSLWVLMTYKIVLFSHDYVNWCLGPVWQLWFLIKAIWNPINLKLKAPEIEAA